MKLTFKTAKALLEAGKPFKAESKRDNTYTFLYFDEDGFVSGDEETGNWSEEQFNEANFQFISFLPRKQFKVGDKVRITDDIKEADDWDEFEENYPNMKATVTEVLNNINGMRYELDSNCYISSSYLIADTEEETKEMTVEQISKELGYEIKVIK